MSVATERTTERTESVDVGTVKMSISLRGELLEELDELCGEIDRPRSWVVQRLIARARDHARRDGSTWDQQGLEELGLR